MMSSKVTPEGVESTLELIGSLTNISSKPIMAFEAVIDLSASHGGSDHVISQVDYFFSNQPLMPGSTSDISVPLHKELVGRTQAKHSATLNNVDRSSESKADAKVTFVQFSDGTTFGASQWADNLTVQRKNLAEIIGSLLLAFDQNKEIGLKSAIDQEQIRTNLSSELSSSLREIQQRFQEKGAPATVQYLKDCLANGQRNSTIPSVDH